MLGCTKYSVWCYPGSMNLKLKTWEPGIRNWNPHPLMHLSFIPFQCLCKCCHLKYLTSLGHHHTMLQWCHDLFWWESLHIHLVNWVGIVTLSRDAKAGALITTFMKGKMVALGAYCYPLIMASDPKENMFWKHCTQYTTNVMFLTCVYNTIILM